MKKLFLYLVCLYVFVVIPSLIFGQTPIASTRVNEALKAQLDVDGKWISILFADGSVQSTATGSVTSVSVTTANGVSGSVANPTTTPAITLSLGAITPTSVASSGAVSGSNLSGTNLALTGTFKSVTGYPLLQPITDNRRRFLENSDGLGSSAWAYNTPQQSAEITGTRTSDTVFTRNSGTWAVNALVGQYVFSFASGTPSTGVWLPITANTTTTVTVSGTLHATGTSVYTSPWRPIANTYAHGQGSAAFIGGVFDGESIWLVPYASANLVKVNPATGGMTTYAHGQGSLTGGVFDGESIWLIPRNSSNLVKVNPTTGGMTTYAHGQGASAFTGGVFDGESIWLVPFNSSNLVKVNPVTGGMTSYVHGQGATAFTGGVFDGESVWLIPYFSTNLVKVNPPRWKTKNSLALPSQAEAEAGISSTARSWSAQRNNQASIAWAGSTTTKIINNATLNDVVINSGSLPSSVSYPSGGTSTVGLNQNYRFVPQGSGKFIVSGSGGADFSGLTNGIALGTITVVVILRCSAKRPIPHIIVSHTFGKTIIYRICTVSTKPNEIFPTIARLTNTCLAKQEQY